MVGGAITTENNTVTIVGKVVSKLNFSHEVYGEGFYNFMLDVPRLSDVNDILPITISERLIQNIQFEEGAFFEVEGQFRSYNSYNNESNKLMLTVFARDIKPVEDIAKIKNSNQIFLNGYVCKKPIYRTTPFGREICDILLAVNRQYNKSDYIPCIAWGRNAKYSENIKVGENIKIWGRVQSRSYQKTLEGNETIIKVAYEVSVIKMEIVSGKSEPIIEETGA
ncbi:MAG: single-stranded DNA-binding protein [Deltaproteobacteria bacterium]